MKTLDKLISGVYSVVVDTPLEPVLWVLILSIGGVVWVLLGRPWPGE